MADNKDNKFPIQHIEPIVVDVKDPQVNYSWTAQHGVINLRKARFGFLKHTHSFQWLIRGIGICAVAVIIVGMAYTAYSMYTTTHVVQERGARIAHNIKNAVNSLQLFDSMGAKLEFRKNMNEFQNIESSMNENGTTKMLHVLSGIVPVFGDVGTVLKKTMGLNSNFFTIADSLEKLKKNGFTYFQTDGEALIALLRTIRDSIQHIVTDAEILKNATAKLKGFSNAAEMLDKEIGTMYLSHSTELYRAESFLDSLISLINSENEKHILLMFQNPSEIRPAGGFLGSYADITVAKGQMVSMDVRDIYDPDGQLDLSVVPPKELQTVTEKWGARDANWFADFPTSAENVMWFLEHSKMYSEKNVTFDMAIAVNIPVVESLIELSGPIALPEYNLVISKENFLREVQREVEAGKDKKTIGQPKTILKKLAPILIDRLKTLNDAQKDTLIKKISIHAEQKDIMIYARDSAMQSFMHSYNLDGSLHTIPANTFGSYVSVINTNVAGGKTDAFIKQSIDVTVHIDTSGSFLTDVSVTRSHQGGTERDPWWNVQNKNYIQLYTNEGSSLVSITGNSIKKEKPTTTYATTTFVERDALRAIEQSKVFLTEWNAWTFSAFQKTVFGSWFFVSPKETRTISFRYHTDNKFTSGPQNGTVYEFYYDKQSGVSNALSVTVNAPIGFIWKETHTPVLTYHVDDAKGFEKFSGTLIYSSER